MEADALHDLTAAYALDALDPRTRARTRRTSRTASAAARSSRSSRTPRARSRTRPRRRHRLAGAAGAHPAAGGTRAAECRAAAAALASARRRRRRSGCMRGDRPRHLGGIPLEQARSERNASSRDQQQRGADRRGSRLAEDLFLARDARRGAERQGCSGAEEAGRPLESDRTYEAWVADGGSSRPAGLFEGGTTIIACHSTSPLRTAQP